MTADRKLSAAAAYLERGWQLFTVSTSKRPWMNCSACPTGAHDGEQCPCLFCHGFQAATADAQKVEQMLSTRPEGLLAVRCGAASGLFVIDAEGTDRVRCGRTGLEVIEDHDWWGSTLKAETSGGGLHLYYRLEAGTAMPSRNRVLHNVDIKADGGYVVTPPAAGRRWLNWVSKEGGPEVPSGPLLEWARTVKGGASARTGDGGAVSGARMKDRLVDGRVPAGERYEFLRDLVYKLRKRGVGRQDAEEACAAWFERFDQPPLADTELPWRQVVYELDRVFARVDPEVVDQRLKHWSEQLRKSAVSS